MMASRSIMRAFGAVFLRLFCHSSCPTARARLSYEAEGPRAPSLYVPRQPRAGALNFCQGYFTVHSRTSIRTIVLATISASIALGALWLMSRAKQAQTGCRHGPH